MKLKRTRNILIITAIVMLAGSAVALAHGGYGGHMGNGGHMMGNGMGPGMMGYGMGAGMGYDGHMMRDGYGYGHRGDNWGLNDEQSAQLEQAREKFFQETRDLRNQMADKQVALSSELGKDNPDSAKAAKLQNELSQLQGNFDQKRLQHQLEVNKILPERAKARGFHRGAGFGACW